MEYKIAGCQFEPALGDIERNYTAIREFATSVPRDVEIAVFPELCLTGYDLNIATEAATQVPGPVTDRLKDIAAETGVTLVVGLPERDGEALYNDLVSVSPRGVVDRYRKQYLWGDEAAVFDAGGESTTIETPVGTVGFLLCYDLNFPEAALSYARENVDVLAVSAAWRTSYRQDWKLLIKARALDTTCYVVGTNHAGDQQGRYHEGGSLIAGPDGSCVDCVGDEFATVSAVVETDEITAARERNPVAETRNGDEN